MLLYIDPGTGSMLFAAMLGVISTLYFLAQQLWLKLKYRVKGGKVEADDKKKEYVFFGEGGQYWNVFRPICDEFEKRGVEVDYYTMDENDPSLKTDYKYVHPSFIGSDNRAFARLNLLKAHVVLATTPGLNVYQWKRSKGVDRYVHIFHDVTEGTGYRMFGMDDYDAVVLSGEFQIDYIRKLEQLRNEPEKELTVVGCTYMDSLMERKLKEANAGHKEFTVLLAPSWGESAILNRFGEKLIQALIDTGFNIIIRPHPQTRKSEKKLFDTLRERFPETDKLHWDLKPDNFESLSSADIMITDFSGVMFDYSLVFGKPLIYADTKLDTAPYDAAWIDEPVWRLQILPDLGVQLKEEDFPRIKEIIEKTAGSPEFEKSIKKVGDTAWQKRGHAAENIADYLLSMREQQPAEQSA
ncbi:MAG: CDP-glycerol glycerophosphotransferase family protein [Lachnospiraceae bacterium]|nr:CDP-glycerol glycerophosphotransferase family protein [Lachnospiraceae bacterium]